MADTRLRPAPGHEPVDRSPAEPLRRPAPAGRTAGEAAVAVTALAAARHLDGPAVVAAVALAAAALAGLRLGVGARAARRSPLAGGLASSLPPVMVAVFLAGASAARPPDAALLGRLGALGLVPFVTTSVFPLLVVTGLRAGRRDALGAGLLTGATAGCVTSLAVLVSPNWVAGSADARLGALAPYALAAMVLLGLAAVLAHQGVVVGRGRSPLALLQLALAVEVAVTLAAVGPPAEVAVDALLVAAAVAAAGLVVATTVASPLPARLAAAEAMDGPRLVGPAVAALTALALAVRLASLRPMWLDEAATARLVRGGFATTVRSGLGADAHPPLYLALAWLARRALGPGMLPLRLPSLVAGTALVPVLYFTGTTGLAAAVIGAFGPPLVWFSVQARPDAVAVLASAASVLAAVRALRRRRTLDWILLGVAEAAVLWAHQLGVVHVAVLTVAVAACGWRDRRHGGGAVLAGATISLALAAGAGAALVAARAGLGPPRVLPPLEFATSAAPGGGTAVFPVLGTTLTALLGFHPPDVAARLLSFWPLGILVALLVLGRTRSPRGALLLALAAAPFVVLFFSQLLGVPRQPPFALTWAAIALPVLALLGARVLSVLGGRWPRARVLVAAAGAALVAATGDQTLRVHTAGRFDVRPAVVEVDRRASRRDLVAYEPPAIGDLVDYEVGSAATEPVERVRAIPGPSVPRVFVVGAFAFGHGQAEVDRTVGLVRQLAAQRPLLSERGSAELKVWTFGPPRRTAQ